MGNNMSLLKEIALLSEEEIQTREPAEVWDENSSEVKTYITALTYLVRPIKDSKPAKFEVFYDEDGKRKSYGNISSEDLNAAFVPVRANQQADVEGFTLYRDADEFEAFKYLGDPVKINLGTGEDGGTTLMQKGDYLLRTVDGNDFVYTVEKARFFDSDYVKKS